MKPEGSDIKKKYFASYLRSVISQVNKIKQGEHPLIMLVPQFLTGVINAGKIVDLFYPIVTPSDTINL